MPIRVYLSHLPSPDGGCVGWLLDYLGCATWAPSERELLDKIPLKASEHAAWLRSHGETCALPDAGVKVCDRVDGDEILYAPDALPATPNEIERTIRLLGYARADLLALLTEVPKGTLDWNPPYKRFASWASWRTIREILCHVARTETDYYLRWLGYNGPRAEAGNRDPHSLLAAARETTLRFLEQLKLSDDLTRLREERGEQWSVRKALRRLVWHELLHTKSIRRILRDYRAA